ncbi:MAG: NADPH-dependent FMN reductase [Saprospiraceae bacterium]
MISIIVGTNRKNNLSQYIAKYYKKVLENEFGIECELIELEMMPDDVLSKNMYDEVHPWIDDLIVNKIEKSDKFIFVIPEYNGSFPGVLKLFIDLVTLKDNGDSLKWKKAALIGVASGRFGNYLGLDQFASVLNYLKVNTFAYKLTLPLINSVIDKEHNIKDEKVDSSIKRHIGRFLKF